MLTYERLHDLLDYDPDTGIFRWAADMGDKRKPGRLAGYRERNGYLTIKVDYRKYQASRLAWLYSHGVPPPHEIDHKDGNPANDRLSNLRAATHSQNLKNTRVPSNNTTGSKGVYWRKKRQTYEVKIVVNGRHKYLGLRKDFSVAAALYAAAAARYFGEFARTA